MGIEEGNYKEQKVLTWCKRFSIRRFASIVGIVFIGGCYYFGLLWLMQASKPVQIPKIELASLDFTVLNITDTRLSAKWDMSIRIPYDLPSVYIYVFKETFKLPSFTRMLLLLPLPHKSKQYFYFSSLFFYIIYFVI